MRYNNITKGIFLDRPNRFIAHCKIGNAIETVHVKNTGRCKELLTQNANVYLEKSDNENRKTKYDLIAVYKGSTLINMDSQAPNKAAEEWLKAGGFIKNPTLVKAEKTYCSSRFDFYIESENEKAFVEVKGVTLENDNIACFPDAPTSRGTKHINELIKAKAEGYRTAILFVVQMKGCTKFIPNDITDPAFSTALRNANKNGVEVIAMDCIVTENTMTIDKPVKVEL